MAKRSKPFSLEIAMVRRRSQATFNKNKLTHGWTPNLQIHAPSNYSMSSLTYILYRSLATALGPQEDLHTLISRQLWIKIAREGPLLTSLASKSMLLYRTQPPPLKRSRSQILTALLASVLRNVDHQLRRMSESQESCRKSTVRPSPTTYLIWANISMVRAQISLYMKNLLLAHHNIYITMDKDTNGSG